MIVSICEGCGRFVANSFGLCGDCKMSKKMTPKKYRADFNSRIEKNRAKIVKILQCAYPLGINGGGK